MPGTTSVCSSRPSFRSIAILLLLIALPAALPAGAPGEKRRVEKADVYVTSKGSDDRIAHRGAAAFAPLEQPDEHTPTILLDRDKTFQSLIGIGGALTDAAAETFYGLPQARQKELLTALFDRVSGNGYSLCRTSIHSCDFSSASFSYAETPGDTLLTGFSIARDFQFKIPFIRAAFAAAGGEIRLFASPWSPPGWMKSNGEMLHGGTLLPRYRQVWADYVVRFVGAYEKAGIPLWGLTVQNEPMAVQTWESCIFTAAAERDFVRDYLGPTLERAGLSRLKLMAWDHNRGVMYQRAKVMFDDSLASRYVWGTAFHWYVGDHFDNVRLVRDAYPEKGLVFTEGTVENFNAARIAEWSLGETYARSMIHDLNNGASGWVDWNVLLDERGGPNHVGNFCMAPVICDTKAGSVTYLSSFYYLGHFSKFIRPGARRIIASSNADDLLATAFQNTDGTIAVVVLNSTEKEITFVTWLEEKACTVTSPARSIVTLVM